MVAGSSTPVLPINPLATVVNDLPDGVLLEVRGELSTATAPALEALMHSLCDGGEHHLVLDLRDADVLAPLDRVLVRWSAVEAELGTYDVRV